MNAIRRTLRRLGKGERKIVAIFAGSNRAAELSIQHVRQALDLPLWLFVAEPPSPE